MQELQQIQQSFDGPWCYIGDFNTVIDAHEQRGRTLPSKVSCEDFKHGLISVVLLICQLEVQSLLGPMAGEGMLLLKKDLIGFFAMMLA